MRGSLWVRGVIGVAVFTAAAAARAVEFKGQIWTPEGTPVAGARAFLYGSVLRGSTEPPTPMCCLACGKSASTDAEGTFVLGSLDTGRVYDVLVVADGFAPLLWKQIDPAISRGEVARLRPRGKLPGRDYGLRGRVVDPQGKPVVGALVQADEPRFGPGTLAVGAELIDPVTLTDARGEFMLVAARPILETGLLVQAAGFARRRFAMAQPGDELANYQLTAGHVFNGRVVRGGAPAAGVEVCLVQSDRSAGGDFVGTFMATTDADGAFRIDGAPPNEKFQLYARMTSLAGRGEGTAVVDLASGSDGAETLLADLEVRPVHLLVGRISIEGSDSLPAGARIVLSRPRSGDFQSTDVGADGTFRFAGLADDIYIITVVAPGYRLAVSNRSLEVMRHGLVGVVDRDVPAMVIAMKRGSPTVLQGHRGMADVRTLITTALRGAE